MKILTIALLSVYMLTISIGYSQDFETDLLKCSEEYIKIKSFDFEIDLLAYTTNTEKPAKAQRNFFKSDGDEFFYKMDEIIYIKNRRCHLVVNDMDRMLVYGITSESTAKDEAAEMKKMMTSYSEVLKKSLATFDSVVFNGVKQGTKHYTILDNDGEVIKYDIFFDVKTNLIQRIDCFYSHKSNMDYKKLSMIYSKIDLSPTFSKNQFSEKKYIYRDANQLIGVDQYKNYQVYLNSNPELN